MRKFGKKGMKFENAEKKLASFTHESDPDLAHREL